MRLEAALISNVAVGPTGDLATTRPEAEFVDGASWFDVILQRMCG